MIARILVIFQKELIDNLRDRRSVISVIATSMISPLLVVALIMVMGGLLNPDLTEKPVELPVVGAENAPALIEFLKQGGVQILPAPPDPRAEVQNGNRDVILVIPAGYGADFTSSAPANVEMMMDTSRMSASPSIQRVRALLDGYSAQVAATRLMVRGVNPQINTVVRIKNVDLATPQSQSLIFLNMLPFILMMVIFMGGMYVVIDATAGERERGSLEPLLINPIPRSELVLGKLLASLPFALAILIITLVTIGVSFNLIPLEQYTGMKMSVSVTSLFTIFLVCLPLILLAAGLQMILASFTRSFKEAQTYLSFLPLVAGLPSAFLMFLSVKASVGLVLVPAFGQGLLINQVMRGEAINPMHMVLSAVVSLILAAISVWIAIRLYQKESILFGTK
jgi:sodium transport system permease protein